MVARTRRSVKKTNDISKKSNHNDFIKTQNLNNEDTPRKHRNNLGKKSIPFYRIPEHKLKSAIIKINERPKVDINNLGCFGPISLHGSRKRQARKNSLKSLLMEARTCLINQDWKNLALILTLSKPIKSSDYKCYYSTFVRYALNCLLLDPQVNDSAYIQNFMDGVLGIHSTAGKHRFMSSLSIKASEND